MSKYLISTLKRQIISPYHEIDDDEVTVRLIPPGSTLDQLVQNPV